MLQQLVAAQRTLLFDYEDKFGCGGPRVWQALYGALYVAYIAMAIVPLRLSEDDVRALDVLVKSGLYKNRSEAARALIRRGAKVDLGGVSKVTETVKRLLAARRKRGRLFTIVYPTKTATQLVAEGRGR